MHIVNIILGSATGGIGQGFIDYCEGLHRRGHQITAITPPSSPVNQQLRALGIPVLPLSNFFGEWDIFAVMRLRSQLRFLQPDVVVAHASRAYSLARRSIRDLAPLIGIAHNEHIRAKRLSDSDAVFATTHDLIHFAMQQGLPDDRVFHIPNMVRCSELPYRGPRRQPPVIGAMGRLVKRKGFDVYIEALRILKERGLAFQAVLGGSGPEAVRLKKQARMAGLNNSLSFFGWINDKKAFYSGIDIFCIPSLNEPFGTGVLEAFIHGAPLVATDSEGPRDIITPNFDALIVEGGNAAALADALQRLLEDEETADRLAANAFAKAKMTYAIERVSERIERALDISVEKWLNERAKRRDLTDDDSGK